MDERPHRLDDAVHRAFVFFLVFFAAMQALVIGASVFGLSVSRGVVIGSLVVAGASAGGVSWRSHPQWRRGPRSSWWARGLCSVALLAGVATWIRLIRLAADRPVYGWDGLYYHVPALHGWVQAGRVKWLDGLVDLPFANGYAMGLEVYSFAVVQLLGHGRWIDASALWMWPLGFFALVALAREIDVPMAWSVFAASLMAQIPVFVALSVSTYIDAAFAIAAWATLATFTRWWRRGDDASVRDTLLVGVAAGLMCTIKGLGWPILFLLLVFAVFRLVGRARVDASVWGSLLVAGLLVVAIGGYWPLRNVVEVGNPLYPVEIRVGEKVLVEGYGAHAMVDQDLPHELRRWPRPLRPLRAWLTFDSHLHGRTATGGLGVAWVFAALPAMIFLATRSRWRGGWPPWWAVFALTLLLLQPGNWWSRFTLWLHGFGLPSLAWVTTLFAHWHRRSAPAAMAVLLAVAAFETEGAVRWELSLGRTPEGDYVAPADLYLAGFSDQPFLEDFAGSTHVARSPWGRVGTLMGGCISLPLDQRRIEVLPVAPSPGEVDALRSRGVQWLIWDLNANPPLDAEVRAKFVETFAYRPDEATNFLFLRL